MRGLRTATERSIPLLPVDGKVDGVAGLAVAALTDQASSDTLAIRAILYTSEDKTMVLRQPAFRQESGPMRSALMLCLVAALVIPYVIHFLLPAVLGSQPI